MDAGQAAVEPTGAMGLAADEMGRFSGLAAAMVIVSAVHGGGAHVHATTTMIASCVRLLWYVLATTKEKMLALLRFIYGKIIGQQSSVDGLLHLTHCFCWLVESKCRQESRAPVVVPNSRVTTYFTIYCFCHSNSHQP
jgi:hypothetical protein